MQRRVGSYDGEEEGGSGGVTPLVDERTHALRGIHNVSTFKAADIGAGLPSHEDYLDCVFEAWSMVAREPQREEVEEAELLVIPDTNEEERSVSEYSQDRHTILDEDDYAAYMASRSTRSSSGADALRTALTRFCTQQGLESDGVGGAKRR